MDRKCHFKIWVYFWLPLLVLMGRESDCSRVEFYGTRDFKNFIKEIDLDGETVKSCQKLDPPIDVGSVGTDRCVMLYMDSTCNTERKSYSMRIDTDTARLTCVDQVVGGTNTCWTSSARIQSFHVCSRELGGGPEVDVDFYGAKEYQGGTTAQFRDVCGCRNLEKSAVGGKTKKISIDNHGNSIDVFEGERCTGSRGTLNAGINLSAEIFSHGYNGEILFDVASFRPANFQDCVKLDASIYKFVFDNGTQDMIKNATEEKVKLATDSILINNGAQAIVQEYTVSGKIAEGVDITTSTGFSNMHTVKAEYGASTEVASGVPFLAEGKVRVQVAAGYQYSRTDTGSTTNRTSVVNEETITVRQQITIQSCRECVATSFVKKLKNFPIKYTAYSRVSGTAGRDRMSAQEVRSALLPEITYLSDFDANTINTMVEGVMFAEFGINSFINVNCKPIPDCVVYSLNSEKKERSSSMEFIIPINKST